MKKLTLSTIALAASLATMAEAGPGLADGAAKFVGNITTRGQVRSDFGTYWNQITAENECKWASIEGTRGRYNFGGCRNAYNWAKQNGGHFKFHALAWGSQYPSWLENLSVDETKKAITDWMDAVQREFPDLEMIDVVNEAIRTGNGQYHSNYPKTKIIQALGGDNNGDYAFITTAFKMARERWPDAILIYNDYNTVQWNKDQGIQLIQTIKKNGAPVDAYGLQAHDMQTSGGGANGTGGGGSCLNINTLKSVLEEIWNKTQTPMFISEYDIATNDDNDQKNCYSQQISYFMENEHVAGITIWGYLYGATWTSGGNSGIIRESNGQVTDRPAMTWLKEYLKNNKGVNTTGLNTGVVTPVDPEPQTPFKGKAFSIPGKIEAEDFDVPGKGRNEDGTSNTSYSENDGDNHGYEKAKSAEDSAKVAYRKDDAAGVDLYSNGTGIVIGYNNTDEWFEYTINVKEAGDYTLFAAVSGEGGKMVFSLDEKPLSDTLNVSSVNAVDTDEDDQDIYNNYYKIKTNITLPEGQHVLRMTVAKQYFDVDYFTIVSGKDATDPEPIGGFPEDDDDIGGNGSDAIGMNLHLEQNTLQDYHVFDMQGVHMGVLSAYGFDAAAEILKSSNAVKSSGVYYLRNRATGKMQSVRVAR